MVLEASISTASLCRLRIGNNTTAVAMPEIASRTTKNAPRATRVSAS